MQKITRDSAKTKQDILVAAEYEFAEKGIYGARIDEIAAKAKINKRMIYEYFGNKEELYKTVLITVYSRLGELEVNLFTPDSDCIEVIRKIISLHFNFLHDNPTYVSLILWENLNKGKYFNDIDLKNVKDPTINQLRTIIRRGKEEKVFRSAIDEELFIQSLITISFPYFSNRYTLSKFLSIQIDDIDDVKKHVEHITEMLLLYLCA